MIVRSGKATAPVDKLASGLGIEGFLYANKSAVNTDILSQKCDGLLRNPPGYQLQGLTQWFGAGFIVVIKILQLN